MGFWGSSAGLNLVVAYRVVKEEMHMTTFETIEEREFEHGAGQFTQVARKVAKSEGEETEFLTITRGYRTASGDRRFRSNVTLPPDAGLVEGVRGALADVLEAGGGPDGE